MIYPYYIGGGIEMGEYKILVCYSGGQTFIGCVEKNKENIIILKNPRILIRQRNAEGETGLLFDYVDAFPTEINFFQFDAIWVPSETVENWYMEKLPKHLFINLFQTHGI